LERIDDSVKNIDSLFPKNNFDLEEMISNKNLADWIHYFTEFLSPKQKVVFLLRDIENLSINEVSFIAKISKGSVKSNLVLARRKIKKKLLEIDQRRVNRHELL